MSKHKLESHHRVHLLVFCRLGNSAADQSQLICLTIKEGYVTKQNLDTWSYVFAAWAICKPAETLNYSSTLKPKYCNCKYLWNSFRWVPWPNDRPYALCHYVYNTSMPSLVEVFKWRNKTMQWILQLKFKLGVLCNVCEVVCIQEEVSKLCVTIV